MPLPATAACLFVSQPEDKAVVVSRREVIVLSACDENLIMRSMRFDALFVVHTMQH